MLLAIAGLMLLLFPLAATFLTSDVSRYVRHSMFADKDQPVFASAFRRRRFRGDPCRVCLGRGNCDLAA